MERKIQVRDFAIAFASNVIAIDDCQRNKLIKEITDIFSWSDIDYVKDWDSGIDDSLGMGDLLGEAFSEDYYYDEDKDEDVRIEGSLEDDVACAIRTAIDLFVSPSGGVVGFTVGDLKKAFNGIIPEWVCTLYKNNLNKVDDNEAIWLWSTPPTKRLVEYTNARSGLMEDSPTELFSRGVSVCLVPIQGGKTNVIKPAPISAW